MDSKGILIIILTIIVVLGIFAGAFYIINPANDNNGTKNVVTNNTLNLSDASDVSGFSGGTFLTNNGEANITSSTISDAIVNNSCDIVQFNLSSKYVIEDIKKFTTLVNNSFQMKSHSM